MVESDNPAGRLHAIFLKAKTPCGGIAAVMCWVKVFDLVPDNSPVLQAQVLPSEIEMQLVERLIQLRLLIDDTEKALRSIEGTPDRYFRPFDRLCQSVPITNLQSNDFNSMMNTITEGDMTVLEFCAERLSSFHVEPVIKADRQ